MLTSAQHETGLGIGSRQTSHGTFDPRRFEFTAGLVRTRAAARGYTLDADRLACVMFLADMDAFGARGASITKGTWVRDERVPWCREMGEGWLHGFLLSLPRTAA